MTERKRTKAEKNFARRLRRRLTIIELEITDNSYTMVSSSWRGGAYRVRLHHMFLAPDTPVDTLAQYILNSNREVSARLDDFILRHRHLIREVPPKVRRERLSLKNRGRIHNLDDILQEVCAEFFDFNPDEVGIAWAPAPRVHLPRRSIKLGSYNADTQLIRIHPALDQPEVPRLFVRWIVYHELLHHVFRRDLEEHHGRVHTPEFERREHLFPQFREALRWERRNLDLLLWWDPREHRGE